MVTFIVWVVMSSLLIFGLIPVGYLTERNINRRADAAIARQDVSEDSGFDTWARSLWLGNPRLLALILRSPTYLSLIFTTVLVFLFQPFAAAEDTVAWILFLLFFDILWWVPAVYDRTKELRKKAAESIQTIGEPKHTPVS